MNGGSGGTIGAGGGGGRMMIHYKDTKFWQGKWTAYGGSAGGNGGAGTIYLEVSLLLK